MNNELLNTLKIGASVALASGMAIASHRIHNKFNDNQDFLTVSGMLFDAEDITHFLVLRYRDTEISEATQATYEHEVAISRATPIYTYSHTTPRTITLRTYFIGDWFPAMQVKRKIDWLKTFLYARDNGLMIKPPKEIRLMLGMYLTISGVITGVSVSHNYQGAPPWGIKIGSMGTISMYSTIVAVDITIQETKHFWTGGQITYDETVRDSHFRLPGPAEQGAVDSLFNLL